jgi:hypothetical protein
MRKRNPGEPNRQSQAKYGEQDAPNASIPAMATGPASPDHLHNFPCFRFILQLQTYLLATGLLGSETKDTSLRSLSAVQVPSTDAHPPQNTEDVGSDCQDANRQCRHLHNICSPVDGLPKIFPPQTAVTLVTPPTGHSPVNSTLGTMPLVTGVKFSVLILFTKFSPSPKRRYQEAGPPLRSSADSPGRKISTTRCRTRLGRQPLRFLPGGIACVSSELLSPSSWP